MSYIISQTRASLATTYHITSYITGKAAPGYYMAKQIIKLYNSVAKVSQGTVGFVDVKKVMLIMTLGARPSLATLRST